MVDGNWLAGGIGLAVGGAVVVFTSRSNARVEAAVRTLEAKVDRLESRLEGATRRANADVLDGVQRLAADLERRIGQLSDVRGVAAGEPAPDIEPPAGDVDWDVGRLPSAPVVEEPAVDEAAARAPAPVEDAAAQDDAAPETASQFARWAVEAAQGAREAALEALDLGLEAEEPVRRAAREALEEAHQALYEAERVLAHADEAADPAVEEQRRESAELALEAAERAEDMALDALRLAQEATADPEWHESSPDDADPATQKEAPGPETAADPQALQTWAAPPMSRGSHGPFVSAAQRLLAERGHSPGVVDGDFGPLTDAAVRAFQAAHGLTADGVIDDRTWSTLVSGSTPVDSSVRAVAADGAARPATGQAPARDRPRTLPGARPRRAQSLPAPARDQAERLFADMLAGGPVPVKRVREEAEARGISWRTVERAKKSSNRVVAERRRGPEGKVHEWWWRLRDAGERDVDLNPPGRPVGRRQAVG